MSVQENKNVTVVIIGAGQAGLSAGYHLQRLGFQGALKTQNASEPSNRSEAHNGSEAPNMSEADNRLTFVMLDANSAPGGAWQHRWESLTVGTLNAIFDLPGMRKPNLKQNESSRVAVPRYFAEFESQNELPIARPVKVIRVEHDYAAEEAGLQAGFIVHTDAGVWLTDFLINATGTWNNPVQPIYPGSATFKGLQLHTRDYKNAEQFTGLRTAIVGGGISALQQLEEISRVTETVWYTRRPPEWRTDDFNIEAGRDVIERVTADVEAGKPSSSVVSYTGLPFTSYARKAQERGALNRRPMFISIEETGVRETDGSLSSFDAILWATGFRGDLKHLGPLELQNEIGGVQLRGTQYVSDERLHLIGFGPSQSTVGANRAGRDAARAIADLLEP